MSDPDPAQTLAALRVEIDAIDAEVHRLLMARGEIIERLIAAKAQQGGGSAFRPGREAEMMRRLVSRHKGILPLDTIESIWRIIIATFTYVQAPYAVHGDVAAGDAAMRDSVRFHFGYSTPFRPRQGPRAVIAAVAAAPGDLGLVEIASRAADGAWWEALTGDSAPKIIARAPFVDRPDHPAGTPVFVVAKPLAEAAAHDVDLFVLHLERAREGLSAAVAAAGGALVGAAAGAQGLSLLVSFAGPAGPARAQEAAAALGAEGAPQWVGSYAAPFPVVR